LKLSLKNIKILLISVFGFWDGGVSNVKDEEETLISKELSRNSKKV